MHLEYKMYECVLVEQKHPPRLSIQKMQLNL